MDTQNNLTLTNILEGMAAPAFPTMTPSLFVVFGLHNVLPAVYSTRIKIYHEDGTLIFDQAMNDTAVPGHQTKARIIAGIRGLVWPKAGIYTVELFLKNVSAGGFTIQLVQAAPTGVQFQQYMPPPPPAS